MRGLKTTAIVTVICALALAACDQMQAGQAPAPEAAPAAPAATAVSTAEPYVGTWAADLASCQIPQEQTGAPHVFTSDGYNQHESHCTFANVAQTGANSWRIDAACQVEGDEASLGWDLTVDGDAMTMSPGRHLVRCP